MDSMWSTIESTPSFPDHLCAWDNVINRFCGEFIDDDGGTWGRLPKHYVAIWTKSKKKENAQNMDPPSKSIGVPCFLLPEWPKMIPK